MKLVLAKTDRGCKVLTDDGRDITGDLCLERIEVVAEVGEQTRAVLHCSFPEGEAEIDIGDGCVSLGAIRPAEGQRAAERVAGILQGGVVEPPTEGGYLVPESGAFRRAAKELAEKILGPADPAYTHRIPDGDFWPFGRRCCGDVPELRLTTAHPLSRFYVECPKCGECGPVSESGSAAVQAWNEGDRSYGPPAATHDEGSMATPPMWHRGGVIPNAGPWVGIDRVEVQPIDPETVSRHEFAGTYEPKCETCDRPKWDAVHRERD